MKEKIRTTSFWIGIVGIVVVIIDCISGIFGFSIASDLVEDLIVSLSSLLVLVGVINKKNVDDKKSYSSEELLEELKDNSEKTDDM